MKRGVLATVLACFLFGACETVKAPVDGPEGALRQAEWSDLTPAIRQEGEIASWAAALRESVAYYKKRPADAVYQFGTREVTAGELARSLETLAEKAEKGTLKELATLLASDYSLLQSPGDDGQGKMLVTAYYEPLLLGSRTRDKRFNYPLYGKPQDLLEVNLEEWNPDKFKGVVIKGRIEGNRFVPYYDRKEIDHDGRLAGKGLEIVWVDDLVQAFFLHVQGSGRVRLPDGAMLRVGYAGANGRSYRSIGKVLIDEGQVPKAEMNMPTLRKWLSAHPDSRDRILYANPSYVFFRILEGEKGPFGNIAVPLTAGRSVATDHRLFPKGAPAVLVTEIPLFDAAGESVVGWKKVTRLVVNQDTGGAIRGPGRVDWFLGFGDESERVAGVMKQGGELYFIAPKAADEQGEQKGFWSWLFSW